MNVLGDEVKEVESFVIVYKYKDRFTSPFARTLRVITKMFGNFWSNVVILVNFWSFNPLHVQVTLNPIMYTLCPIKVMFRIDGTEELPRRSMQKS